MTLITAHQLQNDLEIKTGDLTLPNGNSSWLEILTGNGQKNHDGLNVKMVPVFNYSYSILGELSSAKWGIDCNDQSSCQKTDETEYEDFLNFNHYTYQNAQVQLRLANDLQEEQQNLNVRLVTGGSQKWNYDNLGVLGLSPNGDFANYMRKVEQNGVKFLTHYKAKDKESMQLEFFFDFIVNPKYKDEDVYDTFEFDSQQKNWVVKASASIENTSINVQEENICVTNIDDNIWSSWNSSIECDELASIVCDGKKGMDCNKGNADLKKAHNLIVKIGKMEIQFTPEEYLYFSQDKKKQLLCRFGDPEALRGGQVCDSQNVTHAIGKLFYEKAYPLFEFKNDGTSSLTFLKNYDFPNKHKNWFSSWGYILLIVLLIILIAIFVFLLLKKKRSESGDSYTNL